MKALACDPKIGYFFCSCSLEEVNTILIPFMKDVEKKAVGLRYPFLFVSNMETLNDELAKQKLIKENPYQSKTIDFHVFVGEIPDADLYFVVNPELNELYFVPFDTICPYRWTGVSNNWSRLDKFEFKKMLNLTTKPFTYDNGKPCGWWLNEEDEDRELILAALRSKISKAKKAGAETVFNLVFPYYRDLRIDYQNLSDLLDEGGCHLGPSFFHRDQLHLRMSSSPFEEEYVRSFKKRNKQKEEEIIGKKAELGMPDIHCFFETILDYLDQIIDWDTFRSIYDSSECFDASFDKLDDEFRRKKIWNIIDWNLPSERYHFVED